MRAASMFAGIGGFDRALEALGVDVLWQAEIDEFRRRVLSRRFRRAEQLGDAREIDAGAPKTEILVAGFPCQPSSDAGKKLGEEDPRWLWPEVARVASLLEPRLIVVENVRGLLRRGITAVVRDLVELGYDAQWDLVPAAAVGAPHLRHRIFLVAHRPGELGRVFVRPPIRGSFWGTEQGLPRLSAAEGRQRGKRLEALGDSIVPQVAEYVLGLALAALDDVDGIAPRLIGDVLDDEKPFPRAAFSSTETSTRSRR